MSKREDAIAFYSNLGAHISQRLIDGRPALGVQLRNCSVSDCDLSRLADLASELDVVGLEGTQITDAGLRELVGLPTLGNIDLTDTTVTDAGLDILALIPSLEYVHVERTYVTLKGITKLQASLPGCGIISDHS